MREPPREVTEIRKQISAFFAQTDAKGRRLGSAKCGVYAFYDYDREPIYVGQTVESLRGRVGRHLTGRRSDAVGKFVLDPFEVLEIEVWPLFELQRVSNRRARPIVDAAEHTVYERVLAESLFDAVLNEGAIRAVGPIELPPSFRGRIIPEELYADRKHPDVRIARRAMTIANLARLISERKVNLGLRSTLYVQAQRLEWLTNQRLLDFEGDPLPVDADDD